MRKNLSAVVARKGREGSETTCYMYMTFLLFICSICSSCMKKEYTDQHFFFQENYLWYKYLFKIPYPVHLNQCLNICEAIENQKFFNVWIWHVLMFFKKENRNINHQMNKKKSSKHVIVKKVYTHNLRSTILKKVVVKKSSIRCFPEKVIQKLIKNWKGKFELNNNKLGGEITL